MLLIDACQSGCDAPGILNLCKVSRRYDAAGLAVRGAVFTVGVWRILALHARQPPGNAEEGVGKTVTADALWLPCDRVGHTSLRWCGVFGSMARQRVVLQETLWLAITRTRA